MAFSDWNHIVGATYFNNFTNTQNAILNSNLSSPLTVGSSYCRRLSSSILWADSWAYNNFVLSSGFSSGSFYNIPNSKAIRVQSCIRVEPTYAGDGMACIGTKIPTSGMLNFGDGYLLGIKPSGEIYLYTEGQASAVLTTVSLNVWHNLRLEVYPIGSSSDRIKAYIESGSIGSNVWTTLTDITLNNPSTGYVNWEENRRVGFGTFARGGGSGTGTVIGYFDNFSASVANAPTPIP